MRKLLCMASFWKSIGMCVYGMHIDVCIYICIYVCVCVCVCYG